MVKLQTPEVKELFKAIMSLENESECFMFFEDVCTVKELFDIASRLKAAKLLKEGYNYTEVGLATGMSSATISRVNKCLEYGNGGYQLVLERLQNENGNKETIND